MNFTGMFTLSKYMERAFSSQNWSNFDQAAYALVSSLLLMVFRKTGNKHLVGIAEENRVPCGPEKGQCPDIIC